MLVALFLVNLPFAHQTLTDRRIDRSGQEVEATLVASRAIDDSYLVEYRLPRDVDPQRRRFSRRSMPRPSRPPGRATCWRSRRAGQAVGQPARRRGPNHLFALVAVAADVILLLVAFAWWWRAAGLEARGRRGARRRGVPARGEPDADGAGASGWASRVLPGARVRGAFHLLTEEDVLPGAPVSGLEQVSGAAYVVRGRVVDARAGRALLELDDGLRVEVETGPHRIRADIRDSTEVRGTLCFTPRRGGERALHSSPSCQTHRDPLRSGQFTSDDRM